jgi:hypothetical protein
METLPVLGAWRESLTRRLPPGVIVMRRGKENPVAMTVVFEGA